MLRSVVILCLLFAVICRCDNRVSRVVETQQGEVRGYLNRYYDYIEYLGIPYATAERFQSARPAPQRKGILEAVSDAVCCPQTASSGSLGLSSINEECLVVNVFTPRYLTGARLPVMVYLHGDTFGTGSGTPTIYGASFLLRHRVIVVTFNYRLGTFGFLNLGIKEAPGNMGLKDQRAALRWIKHNIESFGGDPDNVTLFGSGSGAASAIYLTMTPTTSGLFHRIILQSGSVFSPSSFDPTPAYTNNRLMTALGFNTSEPNQVYNILRSAKVEQILNAEAKYLDRTSLMRPSVEVPIDGEEPLLLDTPYNILTSSQYNRLPIVVGYNSYEGLIKLSDSTDVVYRAGQIQNGDLSVLDLRNFALNKDNNTNVLLDYIKRVYFSNTSNIDNVVMSYMNFVSDFEYIGPEVFMIQLLRNISMHAPLYCYMFDYIGGRNYGRYHIEKSLVQGSAHLDELFYLFNLPGMMVNNSTNDGDIINIMTAFWTDFAKYGNPIGVSDIENSSTTTRVQWLEYPYILSIDNKMLNYVGPITPERATFWQALYSAYGHK